MPDATPPVLDLIFPHNWHARILPGRPLILPSRQFVYPIRVEEVERGALELLIKPSPIQPSLIDPAAGSSSGAAQAGAVESAFPFLATCALGFADPRALTGVWAAPHPDWLCAVAGGYAYLINTRSPEQWEQIEYRPVTAILPAQEQGLLLFAGFHSVLAWGRSGKIWQTRRLSWDGLQITRIERGKLFGTGWEMRSDKELEFEVDLETGESRGGGYLP